MEQCFLCGKEAVRRVELQVGSSRNSGSHHAGQLSHSISGTTRHYELKPLCQACITQQEDEAKAALKVAGTVGALALGGVSLGMGMIALMGCLPFLLIAAAGAYLYFTGQR